MRWKVLLPLILAAIAGCTYEEADFPSPDELPGGSEADAEETFYLRAGGQFFTVEASADRIVSPDINLGRYTSPRDRAIRGRAFNRPVNLTLTEGRVTGIVGTSPFNLTISRLDGTLRAEGLVRGALADFSLNDRQLVGHVGPCSYDLIRTGGLTYEGPRTCGGIPVPTTVRLPPALLRWTDPDLAAALGILLSGLGTNFWR